MAFMASKYRICCVVIPVLAPVMLWEETMYMNPSEYSSISRIRRSLVCGEIKKVFLRSYDQTVLYIHPDTVAWADQERSRRPHPLPDTSCRMLQFHTA